MIKAPENDQMTRNAVAQRAVPALAYLIFALPLISMIGGCYLGWIYITPEESVTFQIENGTLETAKVTITVEAATDGAPNEMSDSSTYRSSVDTIIQVPSGNSATGQLPCGEVLNIRVTTGESGATAVELAGDGTGTFGFDSGTTGVNGERYLQIGTHFACSDTIVIQLTGNTEGRITVIEPDEAPPDSVGEPTDPDDPEPTDTGITGGVRLTFRLENATASAADITLTPGAESGDESAPEAVGPVRVPSGEYSMGDVTCGQTYTITATIGDPDSSTVLLIGDGTGTEGFDSASIGLTGERLLVLGDHYSCGEMIVVRITDDGSGIGQSTSETPLGEVNIFASVDAAPEPDLPDPDDLVDEELIGQVELVIVNAVESTVQVNFATGSGSLASSSGTDVSGEFDVRVPSGATSRGSAVCAQEFIIAAAHLEATGTTATESTDTGLFAGGGSVTFHGVVLTGDGTGTEGFDSNSIAVVRGRLLQLGEHFECGDTITVTIWATNNLIKLDDEGAPVVDEFGIPTIQYEVGEGTVTVTSGG